MADDLTVIGASEFVTLIDGVGDFWIWNPERKEWFDPMLVAPSWPGCSFEEGIGLIESNYGINGRGRPPDPSNIPAVINFLLLP